jgi:Coenzyme PQQ synthesis protein D (PqqD)
MMRTMPGEIRADAIDEQFVPHARADIASIELDGELVVAAEGADAQPFGAHWLNNTAALLWTAFDGTASLAEIIDDLSAAFETDRSTVRDDVLRYTRTLGRAGLLAGVAVEQSVE